LDRLLAKTVVFLLPGLAMNAALELNRQALFGAIKIGDVASQRVLAAELETVQLALAEALPQKLLGRGLPYSALSVPAVATWRNIGWTFWQDRFIVYFHIRGPLPPP
jgi:hypothetical protein